VTAYDGVGNKVESVSFVDFDNGFVGFDFSSGVSKVIIKRTDGTDYFTFLDDIRFIRSVTVPESSTFILIMLGFAAIVCTRSRKAGLA
jgi:hypothetical protein